ncbi:hypothetical protein [Miltoncostaea marina]|uniref:hypothetical protein n=1 Tax=Miltoncostaea marina TaxID=2843215 RepID=UPI001C3D602D|nr:hypothetical protein [Miltoncostaea marina]
MSETDTRPAGRRRAESREEIVARVTREQQALHPAPVYGERSRRRLKRFLVAIFPVGLVAGWLCGVAFGWNPAEWIGFAVGLWLALAYLGYVIVTERDDGRVHDEVRRLMRRERGGPPPG